MIQTSAQFELCLPYTLTQEGEDSNDPHDPGGRTHRGIIQREYDRFRRSKGLALQSVYLASDWEVREIYWTEYWLPHCPSIKPGLNLSFFDNCVNEGPYRAIVLLQKTLGLRADGIWGEQTQYMIDNIYDATWAINILADNRERFYRSLRTFQFFGNGWIKRTHEIRLNSLTLLKGNLNA